MDTDFNFVVQLIEQMRSEDSNLRLNSTKNLEIIANALGPVRVRSELIPFLAESTDDEDEILLVMAEKLGLLVDALGGTEFVHQLLVPLEMLCSVEESTVRDKAVESICAVTVKMGPEQISEHYIPMIQRLSQREWFTARISACGLFSEVYASATDAEKRRLEDIFTQLSKDSIPMVRRAACANLGILARKMSLGHVESVLLPLFRSFAEDEHDSVRLGTIDNCIHLATCVGFSKLPDSAPPTGSALIVLQTALAAAGDRSWRVRWAAAGKYNDLANAFGSKAANGEMCSAYEKLLGDSEAEVRTAAAFVVAKVAQALKPEVVLARLLPCLQALVMDSHDHVRGSLASVINELAPSLGRDNTITYLLPLLLTLLRDENSEVRLNIIARLEAINQVIGVDLLAQSLLPAIVELAEDTKWRVRLAIIEHIPQLAQQLGLNFFNDKLCELCLGWLADDVHAVRVAASKNLMDLAREFGTGWCAQKVLPRVRQLRQQDSFSKRMTALYAAQVLSDALDPSVLRNDILPFVKDMASDRVPNIRFNVAKTLEKLAVRFEKNTIDTHIAPVLENLLSDQDRDVRFFTRKAVQTISAH